MEDSNNNNNEELNAELANASKADVDNKDWHNQQIRQLLDMMSPEQQARYDIYRSTAFPKNQFRKLLSNILGQTASERMSAVVAGVCKLHVGQLVEEAKRVLQEELLSNHENEEDSLDTNELPPLRPHHLREASRRLAQHSDRRSLFN